MPITRLAVAAALAACALAPAAAHAADPLDLASTGADRTLFGGGTATRTGWAVAPAGDVNGDGLADAIVGAPGEEQGAGAAYVVFGRVGGSPLSALGDLGDAGFRLGGAAAGDQAGLAVSAAGDVNGDGLGDVAVGAPGAAAGAGVLYVVFGKRTTEPIELGSLAAGAGYRIAGAAAGDGAGTAVASLGDVGGDGVPDLVVGAPTATGGRSKGGAAYVVAGHRTGGDVDLGHLDSGPAWRMNGPAGGFAGLAVAAAPDVNGDGVTDVVVGAPATAPAAIDDAGIAEVPEGHETRGAAYVVFGRGGTAAQDLPTLAPAQGWRLRAGAADAALGTAVAAGDLDGDGAGDVALGAPQSDQGDRKDSGSAYILFGARGDGHTVDLSAGAASGARVLRVDGAEAGDALGAGLAVPGDLDADGRADLVVSAVFADVFGRVDAGAAYRISGPLAPGVTDAGKLPEKAAYAGSTAFGHLRAVSAGGDLDGDGAVDLLLGEPEGTPSAALPGAGTVRVVRGVPKAVPVVAPPTTPDPGVAEERDQDGCRAATRFELLIDDSGSMEDSDPDRLRAKAVELLLAKPGNAGRTFSAVQFGSEASAVFAPTQLGFGVARETAVKELSAQLERDLVADDGGTNYNAGFRAVRRVRGTADARIFLTDGEHNEGTYLNLHREGPPTYVLGLGIGGRRTAAGQRLARIARETKGTFFPRVTRDTVQAVMNAIAAKVNCDLDFDEFVDTLTDHDPEADTNSTILEDGTASADVDVTWGDPLDDVEPAGLVVVDGGKPVATLPAADLRRAAAGQDVAVGGVHVTGRRGVTFVSLHVTGLKGRDRLRVRVAALRTHDGSVRVRTQVAQSRRRR